MRIPRLDRSHLALFAMAFLFPSLSFPSLSLAQCVFAETNQHIGGNRCIAGKVLHVKQGGRGVTYLDFCEDYRLCPFTVVVFPSDLKHVGDVRQLKDKLIEVHGEVKQYDGRAEIILRRPQQLSGGSAMIPPLPKDYDVEKKGHYSAGKFKYPKAARHKRPKRQSAPVGIEDASDPAPE